MQLPVAGVVAVDAHQSRRILIHEFEFHPIQRKRHAQAGSLCNRFARGPEQVKGPLGRSGCHSRHQLRLAAGEKPVRQFLRARPRSHDLDIDSGHGAAAHHVGDAVPRVTRAEGDRVFALRFRISEFRTSAGRAPQSYPAPGTIEIACQQRTGYRVTALARDMRLAPDVHRVHRQRETRRQARSALHECESHATIVRRRRAGVNGRATAANHGEMCVSAGIQEVSPGADGLALLKGTGARRVIAYLGERAVTVHDFLCDVRATADALADDSLADLPFAINLCEDRYPFMVGFCAAALRGKITLLPQSRAPDVVRETLARYPLTLALTDRDDGDCAVRRHRVRAPGCASSRMPDRSPADRELVAPPIEASRCVAIGFTSGSTGEPAENRKSWRSFHGSAACNLALIRQFARAAETLQIVATVPPQHMYGMELSVLAPMLGNCAVHSARPFFPAEIARALGEVPEPRLLVTTPVHLRALIESGVPLPRLAGLVLATAPLSRELARAAEAAYGAPLQEMFGSTETCVIAHRRATQEEPFTLYPEVTLEPTADGTRVFAPWFDGVTLLQDVVRMQPGRQFTLCGRNADLIEIAGKRASLSELTMRVQRLPGVRDAVVFQSDRPDASGVRRVAALVVAPDHTEAELLASLRSLVDPVFLPRPLRCVASLPRNETGKLARSALMALLGK